MKKQMTYSELVNHIESNKYRMREIDVVAWLIGYQGVVTAEDFDNIQKLYADNFID